MKPAWGTTARKRLVQTVVRRIRKELTRNPADADHVIPFLCQCVRSEDTAESPLNHWRQKGGLLVGASFSAEESNQAQIDPEVVGIVLERVLTNRSGQGAFYTPGDVVQLVVQRSLLGHPTPIQEQRVLDPACGAGAFLVEAAKVLLAQLVQLGLSDIEAKRHLAENILFGLDVNPQAIQVTRFRLSMLLDIPAEEFVGIQQANTLLLPTPGTPFTTILMNPPYVSNYSRHSQAIDHADEIRSRFQNGSGRLNLFACFLDLALDWLAPNGAIGALLPDTFASADSYRQVRRRMSLQLPHQAWIDLPDATFGAAVRNVIVIAAPGDAIIQTGKWLHQTDVPGIQFPTSATGDKVRFFRDEVEHELWNLIRQQPRILSEICSIRDGVNPGRQETRQALIHPDQVTDTCRKLITGSCIDPVEQTIHWRGEWIDYSSGIINRQRQREGSSLRNAGVFASPKLVSRQTADTLIFALDESESYVTLNSVHCTHARDGRLETLQALHKLVNSPLARLFYGLDGGETRQVLPQVHIAWLNDFPIPADLDVLETTPQDQVHETVCRMYGLTSFQAEQILVRYRQRYPKLSAADSPAK